MSRERDAERGVAVLPFGATSSDFSVPHHPAPPRWSGLEEVCQAADDSREVQGLSLTEGSTGIKLNGSIVPFVVTVNGLVDEG